MLRGTFDKKIRSTVFNQFDPNAPFFYPLKTSWGRTERVHRKKWVKKL